MIRLIYHLLTYLAVPVLLLRLWLRGFQNHAHWHRWYERLGIYKRPLPQHALWIHAVSLGEVNAITPLIKSLRKQHKDLKIVLTTTTLTGAKQAHSALQKEVIHCFLPFDYYGAVRRFIKKLHPKLGILVETELWPNLLHACRQQRIPMLLANARLSARSAAGYARFPHLITPMLHTFTRLAIQTYDEALRFMQLGALPERISVTGNLKFDQALPADLSEQKNKLRILWGENRPILLAASTHKHEEALLLKSFQHLKTVFPNLLLVLVPRHPERFDEVFHLCQHASFLTLKASTQTPCSLETDIVLGDLMGQLPYYYSAVDLAFLGGSFVPVGGHNSLEAAACGLVTVTGPHIFNFKAVNRLLKDAGALFEVPNTEELTTTLLNLLRNPKLRAQAGERARTVMKENRGSLDAHLTLIEQLLSA